MIMERGHAQTVVERSGHCGIHFVLEKDGVAHHHRFGVRAFCESSPGSETHERRHSPSIDHDLYVVARESDLINAFLLVELAFKSGEIIDLRGIQRGQRADTRRGKNRRQDKKLFHWVKRLVLERLNTPEPSRFG